MAQPNAAFDFIARFPGRIRHVHIHDNHGGDGPEDDLHLPVGAGCIDFPAILRSLRTAGYDAGLSFELRIEHVQRSRDTIRKYWKGVIL